MTPTTSQAVRDAREPGELVREVWIEWAQRQPDAKPSWLAPWAELDAGQREVDALIEAAVRADEAAGLVDILARSETLAAAVVPLFDGNRRRVERVDVDNFPVSWRFTRDEYNAIYDALASFREGMNAVAERRGQ